MGQTLVKDLRGPVEQLLTLVVAGFEGTGRPHHAIPFADSVPGFFEYLASERGLRPASIVSYQHHLDRFEAYLQRVGVAGLHELSPALLSAFVAERSGAGLAKTTVREGCGVLRVFLRYANREGLVRSDLWKTVGWPQVYRLSTIPRSISWDDVGKVLAAVDRRTPCGKRDYAILLLLVTYGLRGREVAALTLDNIDWRRERLAVPERKAGHSTAFPLSGSVGEALLDYRGTAGQSAPTGTSSSGRWRRCGRSAPQPFQAAPDATSCAPGSRSLVRARTRCATARSSDSWTPTSRSKRLGLRRAPFGGLDGDLRQGGRRAAAAGRPRRRRGGARMSESLETIVGRFLEHKRALGRKYNSEEHELRLLVRFAHEHRAHRLDQLTSPLIQDFLASRPRSRPRSFNHLLGVVRGLLDWAVIHELLTASPLRVRRRRVTSTRIPFLFDAAGARRLLAAAALLPDNPRARGRGPTYRTIFALCYGLGLRAGEACGLRLHHIDMDRRLLVVRGGKFGKSRLVPHGPRIADLVANQVQRRRAEDAATSPDAALFSFDGHSCVHPGTASATFHRLVATLDLTVPDGVCPPTLHSLRHSFAVGCLLRWYREGLDPSTRLHHLSTFMGHVDPTSTAVYLTITPQLLEEANRRFETFAEPAWAQVTR